MFDLLLIAFILSPRVRRNGAARFFLAIGAVWTLMVAGGVPFRTLALAGGAYLISRFLIKKQAAGASRRTKASQNLAA